MTFDKKFKAAISGLSHVEKDKLIFRLLRKDVDVANQLLFELLGNGVENRRKEAQKQIENYVASSQNNRYYFTPGVLLMDMRDASGIINEHVKITKDRYGEVELQIFVLKEYLQIYNNHFKNVSPKKSYTINIYMVAKAFKIMTLLKKLHEDFVLDFAQNLKEIGFMFGENSALMDIAIRNGLDVNWLIQNNIPNNIAEIEKHLRQNGFLR